MQRLAAICVFLFVGLSSARSGDDFVPMFNGKDLTGWFNVNCAPDTFYVKDGMIITTGIPTGYLRTAKQYENFIAEFDWMHVPAKPGAVGNSGFFVWCDPIPALGTGYTRGIEVQVLVNLTYKNKNGAITATSQGDLFSIHGASCVPDRPHPDGWARCLPFANYCKGEREWNHYRVEANDGVLKLAVNGKVVSGVSKCNPRKGYLALESEGSECRFKNLKIKELPSTNPKPNEVCDIDQGFKSLFTGIDLTNWKATKEHARHWKMNDGVLTYDGKYTGKDPLWTEKSYGDFELVFDCRFERPGESAIFVRFSDRNHVDMNIGDDTKVGQWNRYLIRVKGDRFSAHVNGKLAFENRQLKEAAASGPLALSNSTDRVQFRNMFIRELKSSE
jgi:hypothetical protein